MSSLGLKHRGNFRVSYIKPAIAGGYIAKLYPDSNSSRSQAYYLTPKGMKLLTTIKNNS